MRWQRWWGDGYPGLLSGSAGPTLVGRRCGGDLDYCGGGGIWGGVLQSSLAEVRSLEGGSADELSPNLTAVVTQRHGFVERWKGLLLGH